jgi:hypothetical protein
VAAGAVVAGVGAAAVVAVAGAVGAVMVAVAAAPAAGVAAIAYCCQQLVVLVPILLSFGLVKQKKS